MLNRLRDVFESLSEHEVRYLVIGGIAAVLHGVPRATFDLDLLTGRRLPVAHRPGNEEGRRQGTAGLRVGADYRTPRYGCTVIALITTGVTGTFPCAPCAVVWTPAMASTTSIPSMTSPKTA